MQPSYASVKRRRHWKRWVLLGIIMAGAAYYWQHRHHAPEKKPTPPVQVVLATAMVRDVPQYAQGLGTVQANNTVTVRTRVDGQIMAIKFREGQPVKAGDVLAQLDPRPFEATLHQALATKAKDEAALENAQVDLKRYKKLGDSIARQTVDTQSSTIRQLTAQIAADAAAIDSARTQLSYATITAPISGRTGLRQIDVGNVIHAGDANGLVVITQLQPVAMLFSLPQQELGAINAQLSQTPKLGVDALAADNTTVLDSGELLLIDNQIDQATGSIKLKAIFPNRNQALWPGAFVNARLLVAPEHGALTVPSVAVQQGPKGAFVFLYHADTSKVTVQPVTIARVQDTQSVVSAGISVDDQVVIEGMAKLQDGSAVSVAKPAEPATANTPKG